MDLGLSTLATLSDRTTFENPKALARHGRKLERLQRAVSRLCSNCGCRKPMTPHVRVYECLACGFVDNRDHNAAVNLEPSRLVAVGSPDTLNARQRPEVQTERLVPVDEARINGR